MIAKSALKDLYRTDDLRPKRAARSRFLWQQAFIVVGGAALMFLAIVVDGLLYDSTAFEFGLSASVAPDQPPKNSFRLALAPATFFAALFLALLFIRSARRRLHDAGRSGLWLLLIPFALATAFAVFTGILPSGWLGWMASLLLPLPILISAASILLTMLLWPGFPGTNPYGPNPLEVTP